MFCYHKSFKFIIIEIPKLNPKRNFYIAPIYGSYKESIPEKRIRKVLEGFNVSFIQECSFKGFGFPEYPFRYDFYIPKHNLIIEYDGRHHSQKKVIENDRIKNAFCRKNNIKIVRFNNKHYYDLEKYVKRLLKKLTK